ncbi:MAG: fatty acid desaturase family protein [Myxococcota bacterium]|nr:fatty acid desaturase family protein [Myxococcota bacterium]
MQEAAANFRKPAPHWRDALSREEIQELTRTNNWRGFLSIALDWGLVFAAMALVAAWPNPFTIVAAIVVIGARQLGFAVLMHEAAHGALFRDKRLNDWAGNWLCAFPIWADLRPYRRYHLQHHAKNWTKEDPDLDLATKFPVSAQSMRRKIWRDLSGQVGWKRVKAVLRRDLSGRGFKKANADTKVSFGKTAAAGTTGWENLRGVVVSNAVLLLLLTAAGHPALYLLWVVAWFTTNSLVTRIRSIAEHNMVPDTSDELRNTRTTLASWWERLFIAPNRVNYHLEHHLLMTVPLWNLPKLHRLLRERGVLDGALVDSGYIPVLRQAASG